MIKSILFARALERQVEMLLRSGRKGEKAVENYRMICGHLRRHCGEVAEIWAKRTKNGELRVKNCVKYHLGHGYRLITIRLADRLYLTFLGTHDEVDQWLDGRRREGFEPVESAYRQEWLPREQGTTEQVATCSRSEPAGDDIYERQLAERIDDALLKVIFTGLHQRQADGQMTSQSGQ